MPSKWKMIFGDFTGDGLMDYADLNVSGADYNGYFWIHRNLGSGSFDDVGSFGLASIFRPNADWTLLGE